MSRAAAASNLRQFRLLARVNKVINTSLDPRRVLNLVLSEAVDITRATSGSIALVDPHTQQLEIEVAIGLSRRAQQVRLPIGRGVTGWVAKTARPLRVGDVTRDPRYVSVRRGVRSELAVPLVVEGALIGVLNVDSTRRDAFRAADEALLVALADQSARVIYNSWLYEAVAHNAHQLEALFAVAESIIASHDLAEILQRVTRDACRLMDTKVCALTLLDAARDHLELRACHGAGPEYLHRPPLPLRDSLLGVVITHGKPVRVYNVQEHDAYRHLELARREGLVSLLAVPLLARGTVIGALSVYTAAPRRFSTQDMKSLSALANLAAIAISNAQLHDNMVQAEEQLRRNERLSTLGLLAAEIAHEIRNPLTVIKLLYHSLGLEFPAADPRARDAEVIAAKMEQLNLIVDQLLSYARSTEPQFAALDANALVTDLLLLVRHRLQQQEITATCHLADPLPLVRGDRGQLEQACLNLVLNACDAMPHGGQLTITTAPGPGVTDPVCLSLRDTGSGIPADQQARLFQPFLTTRAHGTGLGLAIVHKIIEAHHGRIELDSQPHQGTTFRLYLPVAEPGG